MKDSYSEIKLSWRQTLLGLLLIVVLGALVYSNTFYSPFVFDDIGAIVSDPGGHVISLTRQYMLRTRVIPYLTFDLNYRFGQLNVAGYHIVNITIHLLSAVAVYWLGYYLSRRAFKTRVFKVRGFYATNHWLLGLLMGLLFAVHPLQTQAVTYVVQRLASMTTLFYLLALLGYVKYRLSASKKGLIWALFSLLAAVLAMHSKEIAVTIPAAIVMIEAFFFSATLRKLLYRIPKLIPWLLLIFIIPSYLSPYSELRLIMPWLGESNIVSSAVGFWNSSIETDTISRTDYFLTQLNVVRTYTRLLWLPIGQNLDYDYPLSSSLFEGKTAFSLVEHLLLLGLAVWLFKKKRKFISFGILFFYLALSVESSFFPIKDVIFEHRLYLPMFGFVMIAGGLMQWLLEVFEDKRVGQVKGIIVVLVGAGLLLAGLAVTAYQRNAIWKNETTLWTDVVKKSPDKPRPHNNLGLEYIKAGKLEEASEQFSKAIELDENYAEGRNNLGMMLIGKGELDQAEEIIREAIKINPDYSHAYNNLGAIFSRRGEAKKAEEAFIKATELDPVYIAAWDNLGMVFVKQSRFTEAEKVFLNVLEMKPNHVPSLNNLGVVYYKQGRVKEALIQIEKALSLDPSYKKARENARLIRGEFEKPDGLKMLN